MRRRLDIATFAAQILPMYSSKTKLRVRYAETDQMGYVYYGNYAIYYEVARVEALRNLGLPYKELEEGGIMLPVVDFQIKFNKPAFYDEELTIEVSIPKIPLVKLFFEYKTFNAKGELLNTGSTSLAFIQKESGRPCGAPQAFIEKIDPFFKRKP